MRTGSIGHGTCELPVTVMVNLKDIAATTTWQLTILKALHSIIGEKKLVDKMSKKTIPAENFTSLPFEQMSSQYILF